MPKTSFVNGTPVEAEWLNAIQNLQFTDQDLDGHYPKITDASLSDTPGQIKPEWRTFRDTLAVSAGTGLAINYTGGMVTLVDGLRSSISPGALSLSNNTTTFIFVSETGAISQGSILPVRGIPLARVTTAAGVVSAIEDLRPRFTILPQARSLRVFGGSGSQGSYTLNSGTDTLSGEYFFTDFTVAAGATLTIRGAATIYCSGNVNIAGTVTVTPPVKGGQGYVGNLSNTLPNAPGFGLGGGNSINAGPSETYSYLASTLGSGGAGGWVDLQGSFSLRTPGGGNGGGNLILEAAGTIQVSGTIRANGGNGEGATAVTNLQGGAPVGVSGSISGGGGGSGGLIWLRSLRSVTATASAVLSVTGGNGGTGFPSPTTQFTAGGGGGGYVVATAPTVNLTGATINLSGGTSGIATGFGSVSGGSFGGAGGAPGSAGQVGQLVVRNVIPV